MKTSILVLVLVLGFVGCSMPRVPDRWETRVSRFEGGDKPQFRSCEIREGMPQGDVLQACGHPLGIYPDSTISLTVSSLEVDSHGGNVGDGKKNVGAPSYEGPKGENVGGPKAPRTESPSETTRVLSVTRQCWAYDNIHFDRALSGVSLNSSTVTTSFEVFQYPYKVICFGESGRGHFEALSFIPVDQIPMETTMEEVK